MDSLEWYWSLSACVLCKYVVFLMNHCFYNLGRLGILFNVRKVK